MMEDRGDDTRAVVAQAARIGLHLPPPILAGVAGNLALLAEHHAALRDALDEEAR